MSMRMGAKCSARMLRRLCLGLVTALIIPAAGQTASHAEGVRPVFTFSTDEAFDADTVPAYAANHDEVYAHIDEHIDEHVAHLQRWIRQPSISPQGVGDLLVNQCVYGQQR